MDPEKNGDSKIWDFKMSRTQTWIKNRKNICKREKNQKYYVKIYEIDSYFYECHKEII